MENLNKTTKRQSIEPSESLMKKENEAIQIIKKIEKEDEENELQKKKEEEFFEKFKNGENLEEDTITNPEEADEDNSEKGEVFYPGDTVEFDGDKIIKVEKSKEETTIPTPEEVKTEKPKETGTENSKETTNENEEVTTSAELNDEEMDSVISPKNKEGFKKLSKKSQSFMSKVYSGLIKIPVANRFIGKMEIAYNQFLFDKKEKQRIELKSKLYGLETRSETLDEVKRLNKETAEFLEGIDPNAKNRVEKEATKIDKEKDKIETKIDKINSKISQKEISLGIFKNRRDAVVDRLITNYEIKASPLEGKIKILIERKKEIEEISKNTEILIKLQEEKINELKNKRDETRRKLSVYYSEKDVDKNESIKNLDENINLLYLNIQEKRKQISEEKIAIETKINKKIKKISPYIIKKNELLRIKSREMVDIDFNKETIPNTDKNTKPEEEKESTEEKEKMPTKISQFLKKYNEYLEKTGDKNMGVTEEEVFKRTAISDKNAMNKNLFKKVLAVVYDSRGIPKNEYNKLLNNIK